MKNKIIAIFVLTIIVFAITVFDINHTISKFEAEQLVKSQSEVAKLTADTTINWHVDAINKEDYWIVQVYQVVQYKDHPENNHESTFNWYKVDKKSGQITCSMFLYDSKGVLNKNGKVNNCY